MVGRSLSMSSCFLRPHLSPGSNVTVTALLCFYTNKAYSGQRNATHTQSRRSLEAARSEGAAASSRGWTFHKLHMNPPRSFFFYSETPHSQAHASVTPCPPSPSATKLVSIVLAPSSMVSHSHVWRRSCFKIKSRFSLNDWPLLNQNLCCAEFGVCRMIVVKGRW